MEAILVGIGDFRPACYIQDIIEDFRSDFRNGLLSRRNAASEISMRSNQLSFISLRLQTLMTGAMARP